MSTTTVTTKDGTDLPVLSYAEAAERLGLTETELRLMVHREAKPHPTLGVRHLVIQSGSASFVGSPTAGLGEDVEGVQA